MNHRCKELLWVTLAFSLLLALFFWPAFLKGQLLYQGDLTCSDLLELNIPRRILVAQALKQGEIPLWEPKIGDGTPLLAEGHPGPFYPTTLPLYGWLSPTTATNISIAMALLTAMLGSYALARSYGATPLPAAIAALAYGLGGTFLFRLKNINIIQIIAWMPAALALIRMFMREGRTWQLVSLAIIWGMQLLAGHPQAAFISQMACWSLIAIELTIFQASSSSLTSSRARALTSLLACAALALMLGAIQLLPTFSFAQESSRAQAYGDDYLQTQSLQLHHLQRFIQPYCDGNPVQGTFTLVQKDLIWESTPYLGLLPLLLLPFAFIGKHRRYSYYIAGLSLFFLALAFGPKGQLFSLLSKFCPGFGFFRYPERFIIPMACFMALLSALGAQNIWNWLAQREKLHLGKAILGLTLVLTALDLYRVSAAFQSYLPADWSNPPKCLEIIGNDHQRIHAPTSWLSLYTAVVDKGWYNDIRPILADAQTLPPDLAPIWGVASSLDYNSIGGGISIESFKRQLNWLNGNLFNATYNPQEGSFRLQHALMPMLRLNNISHIVSFIPIKDASNHPSIAKVSSVTLDCSPDRPLYVYELAQRLPEMRLVPELTDSMPVLLQRGLTPLHDDGNSLYEPDYENLADIGKITLISDSRNERILETECERPSYLVLSSTYHPGWSAIIDNHASQSMLKVNYNFQGLSIPAGHHRVILRFRCPAFEIGWKISVAGVLLLMLGAWFCNRRESQTTPNELL